MLPTARALPFTVSTATGVPVVAVKATEPRIVVPRVNLTLPVGAADPLAAFMVAVNCVVAVEAMVVGFAVTVVVVLTTGGGVTETVVVPVELPKLPVGV